MEKSINDALDRIGLIRHVVRRAQRLGGARRRAAGPVLVCMVDPSKSFVKRVAAGPNDVIRSVEGRVTRNDVPLPDDSIPSQFRSADTWGPTLIPPGDYFVLGDHRNNSSDSRSWGLVPKKYIVGRVRTRIRPESCRNCFLGATLLLNG